MLVCKINKKAILIFFLGLFIISLCFNVHAYLKNAELEKRYESIVCVTNQFDKTKIVSFVASSGRPNQGINIIEVFDVVKGEVSKTLEITADIKKEVTENLNKITGLFVKVKALPDDGIIIKVPLNPPVQINNQWVNDTGINTVSETYIIMPENESPYILILDNKFRPFFFTYEGNNEILIKSLDKN